MPKLLQKNICKNAVFTYIPMFVYMVFFGFRKIHITFILLNFTFVILNNLWIEDMREFPDYMYIAPFSYEQRRKLIEKVFRLKRLTMYFGALFICIVPILISAIIKRSIFEIVLCITEIVMLFSLIYCGNCFLIPTPRKVGAYFVKPAFLFMSALFCGLEDFTVDMSEIWNLRTSTNGNIVDIVVIILIVIMSLGILIVFRRKYYEPVISYFTDYETRRQIN